MASKTEIANRALSKVGEQRVSNIDTDNIKAAKVIRYMWDIVRDKLLTSHPWNFAIERTELAADGTAPAWGYNKRFQIPSDFLALLEIKSNPDYKLEGRYILTNASAPLKIRYIKRITNTGDFDPMFTEALAADLAVEACEELTQSNTKKQILMKEREDHIKQAYANDAIQDPPQYLQADTWILSREDSYYDDIDYNNTITS